MGKGRLSIYGKRKMKKALSVVVCLSLYKANRFHAALGLFSNRSQKTSKCGKNISDIICDLLLNRRKATWNLFVKYVIAELHVRAKPHS